MEEDRLSREELREDWLETRKEEVRITGSQKMVQKDPEPGQRLYI